MLHYKKLEVRTMVDWNEKKGRMTKELLAPLFTPPMVEQICLRTRLLQLWVNLVLMTLRVC